MSDGWAGRAARHAGRLGVALAAAVCAWALAVHFELGPNSDNQSLLDQTQRWLDGAGLYTQIVVPSPPMIFALYAPAVAASRAGGWPAALALDAWTSALIAGSLLLCGWILRRVPRPRDALGSAAILATIAAALVILPLRDQVFADRDHLFAVLIAPYLLALAPLAAGAALPGALRVLIASGAALALAIRPYYLAIWAMSLAYAWLRGRSLRRLPRRFETGLVAALYAAYLLVLALAAREYFTTVAPMAWQAYPAISAPLWHRQQMLLTIGQEILWLPLAALGLLLWLRPAAARDQVAYLWLLCLGAGAAAFAGGWHYAYYPLYALAFVLVVSTLAALLAAARDAGTPARAALALLAALALCALPLAKGLLAPAYARAALDLAYQRTTGFPRGYQHTDPEIDAFFERHLRAVREPRFLLLGNGMWDARLAAFDRSARSVSRFYALWPLPALIAARGERARRVAWIEAYLLRAVAEDLQRERPELVFVERSVVMWGLPRSFDVLGFFQRDPAFAQAFRGYARVDRIDLCARVARLCAFEVFYRDDLSPPAPARPAS